MKVLDSCAVPASTHDLDATTRSRQQVCENTWIWRMPDVKRMERRVQKPKTLELMLAQLAKYLRIEWTGHMVRMKDEILPKTFETEKNRVHKTRKITADMGGYLQIDGTGSSHSDIRCVYRK